MEKEKLPYYTNLISQYMSFVTAKQSPKQNPIEHEILMKNAIEQITYLWKSDICINKALKLACTSIPLRLRDYLVFLFNISSLPNLFTSGERFVALESITTIIQKCSQSPDPDIKKIISSIIDRIFFRLETAPPEQLFEIINFIGRLPSLGQSYQLALSKFVKDKLKSFKTLKNLEKEAICELISRLHPTLFTKDLYSLIHDLVSLCSKDPTIPETTKAYVRYAFVVVRSKLFNSKSGKPPKLNLLEKIKKYYLSAKEYKTKKVYIKSLYFLMRTNDEFNRFVREFLMDIILNSDDIGKDYAYESMCKELQRQKNHDKDNDIAEQLANIGYSHVSKHIRAIPNQYVFLGLIKIAISFPKYYYCVQNLVSSTIDRLIACPPFGRIFLDNKPKTIIKEEITPGEDLWPEPQKNVTLSNDANFVYQTRGYIFQLPSVNNFDFFNLDECFEPIPSFNCSPIVPIFTDQISIFIALMENKNLYDDLLPIASITFRDRREFPGRQKPSVTLLSLLDNFSGNVFFQLLYSIVLMPDMLEQPYGKGIILMVISNYTAKNKHNQRKKY